jgi:hypothetical protein
MVCATLTARGIGAVPLVQNLIEPRVEDAFQELYEIQLELS